MLTNRPALATSSTFGRRARALTLDDKVVARTTRADDLRLFAYTFAAGFLFVSVYLA